MGNERGSMKRRTVLATVAAVLVAGGLALAGPVTPAGAAPPSRCATTWTTITCARNTTTVWTGDLDLVPRQVHWQVPTGTAPARGWPVVIMFSPSLYSSQLAWSSSRLLPAGAYYQTASIKALLDAGYAVITPENPLGGYTAWATNLPLVDYESSNDRALVDDLLAGIGTNRFGPLDADRRFATGMSSGGYMTSRMAVSHPGAFRALAVQSGSYATCAGPLCPIPQTMPADHPPTLFLHGKADFIVPIATMYPYRDRLRAAGVPTRTVTETWARHEFLAAAPGELVAWFRGYDPGA